MGTRNLAAGSIMVDISSPAADNTQEDSFSKLAVHLGLGVRSLADSIAADTIIDHGLGATVARRHEHSSIADEVPALGGVVEDRAAERFGEDVVAGMAGEEEFNLGAALAVEFVELLLLFAGEGGLAVDNSIVDDIVHNDDLVKPVIAVGGSYDLEEGGE